jgi:hypothetical protein
MSFHPFTLMIGLLLSPAFSGDWVIIEHGPTLRLIQGVVEFQDGSPAEGIVMELRDQPDVILGPGSEWQRKQKLIGNVTTDHNGRFKFPKVPSGRYEVRAQSDLHIGTIQTSVIVRVRSFWFWPLGQVLRIRLDLLP